MSREIEEIKQDIHTHFLRLVEEYQSGGEKLKELNTLDLEVIEFTKILGEDAPDQQDFMEVMRLVSVYFILSSFFLLAHQANNQLVSLLKEVPSETNEVLIKMVRETLKHGEDSLKETNSFRYVREYAKAHGLDDPELLIDFTTPRLAPAND